MSSKDYHSLTSEEINVKSAFSFESSFDFAYEKPKKSDGGVGKFNDELTKEYVKHLKPECCDGAKAQTPSPEDLKKIIDAAKKDPKPKVPLPEPWSISASVKNKRTNEETRFKKNDEKAFSKVDKNTRVSILPVALFEFTAEVHPLALYFNVQYHLGGAIPSIDKFNACYFRNKDS